MSKLGPELLLELLEHKLELLQRYLVLTEELESKWSAIEEPVNDEVATIEPVFQLLDQRQAIIQQVNVLDKQIALYNRRSTSDAEKSEKILFVLDPIQNALQHIARHDSSIDRIMERIRTDLGCKIGEIQQRKKMVKGYQRIEQPDAYFFDRKK